MYSAVLLSGGKGMRMKRELPKQYLLLGGKPIIMHSLERLDKISEINEIIIVCESAYRDSLSLMIKQYCLEKPVKFAEAGKTRQQSVYNGLLLAENESVIIHEAARPFAVIDDYMKLIRDDSENAILGAPIPFTVVKGGDFITDTLDRSQLLNVQLPQKFNLKALKAAHEQAMRDGLNFTEDASMLYHYTKCKIRILEGNSNNIKITEPTDLIIGETIFSEYIVRRI